MALTFSDYLFIWMWSGNFLMLSHILCKSLVPKTEGAQRAVIAMYGPAVWAMLIVLFIVGTILDSRK